MKLSVWTEVAAGTTRIQKPYIVSRVRHVLLSHFIGGNAGTVALQEMNVKPRDAAMMKPVVGTGATKNQVSYVRYDRSTCLFVQHYDDRFNDTFTFRI